jgi:hypothetical protein
MTRGEDARGRFPKDTRFVGRPTRAVEEVNGSANSNSVVFCEFTGVIYVQQFPISSNGPLCGCW